MATPRRLVPASLLATAFLLSCDPDPTVVCVGGPPQCNGAATPTTVAISPAAVTLIALGETVQLTATVLDQLGEPMDTIPVTWSSTIPEIATVTAGGLVTAVQNGVSQITASAPGASGNISATVSQAPADVVISPDPVTLPGPGSAAVLTVSATDGGGAAIPDGHLDLSWTSDDTGVATVIDEGVVTGVAEGATTLTVEATGGGVTAEQDVDVTVSAPTPGSVVGMVRDAETSLVISGASITLDGASSSDNTTSDGSGEYVFNDVDGGTYTLTVTAGGYVTATSVDLEVAAGIGDVVLIDFALTPNGSTIRFGGLSGKVTFGGAPLEGAAVSISGGEQTNGIFQSTLTDENGNYSMVGVNMDDTEGMSIDEFTVVTTRDFSAVSQTLPLIQNQTIPNVDLNLEPVSSLDLFFEDDFESPGGWQTTGFWNRSTLSGVSNSAYPTYVNLAPGDPSNGALPSPNKGQFVFWYGEEANGNFLGEQVTGDTPNSGGTSTEDNEGSLTSPSFTIPSGATSATLRFSTWFEIESVNPNASGFDVMNISVLPSGASTPTLLARLNPFVDPTLPDRAAIPFTSGGFNLPPVWRTEFLDLEDFIGQTVQLVFSFDTVDGLYNGFRGWIIDEVSVSDLDFGGATPAAPPIQVGPPAPRTR